MRKVIVIALAVCLVFGLTACGSKPSSTSDNSAPKASEPAANTDTKPSESSSGEKSSDELPPIEPVTFKWAMSTAIDHPASIITQELCDEVNKRTNGAVTIELYVANTLGSEAEITDMVRGGTILGGAIGIQMFENYVPELAGWRLPFTFASADEFVSFFNEYAVDEVMNKKVLETTGVYTFAGHVQGLRQLTTKGVAVHKPGDLKGVLIRSMEQPVSITMVEALGANPIPIAWSELYMALQTGVAVGQENAIANVLASKFYEVQDYIVLTNHAGSLSMHCVNYKVFSTLPVEYQQLIEQIWVDGANRITQECLGSEEANLQELADNGMKVITYEELDIDAFKAKAEEVINKNHGNDKPMLEYRKMATDWIAQNYKK